MHEIWNADTAFLLDGQSKGEMMGRNPLFCSLHLALQFCYSAWSALVMIRSVWLTIFTISVTSCPLEIIVPPPQGKQVWLLHARRNPTKIVCLTANNINTITDGTVQRFPLVFQLTWTCGYEFVAIRTPKFIL